MTRKTWIFVGLIALVLAVLLLLSFCGETNDSANPEAAIFIAGLLA